MVSLPLTLLSCPFFCSPNYNSTIQAQTTMKYKPEMNYHTDAEQIFIKAGWSTSFQPSQKPTHLLLQKIGSSSQCIQIPTTSYATHRLPANFFLTAFKQAEIVDFDGFAPSLHDLIKSWDFYEVKNHLEKRHLTKPDCRVVLHLDAGIADPYLLLIEDSGRRTILFGQPKSIFHFLDALEVNGFFKPDKSIEHSI